MVDANDSKSFGSDTMPVRVRPRGPLITQSDVCLIFLLAQNEVNFGEANVNVAFFTLISKATLYPVRTGDCLHEENLAF